MICPSCNAQNPSDAQFCVSCGAPLATAPAKPEGYRACPSCATQNPPDAQFCVTCGAPLSTPEVAQPYPEPAPVPEIISTPPPSLPHASQPPKERSLALILEVLPALIGIFGVGWIYSGNTPAGVAWLAGALVWEFIGISLSILTVGLGCLCFVPVNLILIAISASLLYTHTKQHPELFGA